MRSNHHFFVSSRLEALCENLLEAGCLELCKWSSKASAKQLKVSCSASKETERFQAMKMCENFEKKNVFSFAGKDCSVSLCSTLLHYTPCDSMWRKDMTPCTSMQRRTCQRIEPLWNSNRRKLLQQEVFKKQRSHDTSTRLGKPVNTTATTATRGPHGRHSRCPAMSRASSRAPGDLTGSVEKRIRWN